MSSEKVLALKKNLGELKKWTFQVFLRNLLFKRSELSN